MKHTTIIEFDDNDIDIDIIRSIMDSITLEGDEARIAVLRIKRIDLK